MISYVEWCEHYSRRGEHHVCAKGVNIVAMCGGRTGIRFKMPCNTDTVEGHAKISCAMFRSVESDYRESLSRAREARKAQGDTEK